MIPPVIKCWRMPAPTFLLSTARMQAKSNKPYTEHALWVRTPERVTADVLDAGKNLIVVSTSGFRTDNIDIPAATERGILVVNHRGFGRVPVSEHAIMLMLAAMKQLVWADRAAD
jgi:phosphoglycerate dehydrogenase-like enzyme